MSHIEPEKNRKGLIDKAIKYFFLIAIIVMIGIGLKASLFPNFHIENLIPKKENVEPEKNTQEIIPEKTKASNQELNPSFDLGKFFNSLFAQKKVPIDSSLGKKKADSLHLHQKKIPIKPKIDPPSKEVQKIEKPVEVKHAEIKHPKKTELKSRIEIETYITPNDTIIWRREIKPNGTIIEDIRGIRIDTLKNEKQWGNF